MPYINKVDSAQKIYAEELSKIGQSAEKWKDFLDFSAKSNLTDNSEVSEFSSKVIIHAYNPNAVDCRTYDDWKKQEGNHVSFRAKGIPILSRDRDGRVRVAHVFDTSQTVLKKLPQMPEISNASKERLKQALQEEIKKFRENPRFNDEQKRLFAQTAEYKLSKQYGLETNENADRFSGIEKLSVNEKAFIGIALNGCSRSFAQIVNNERSISNERNNSNARDDRTEFHRREPRGMDMGGGVQGTRQEVRVRGAKEPVVQAQRGERDIRTSDRDTRTEAYSGNGQVRQSAAEIHMADPVPDRSVNAERESRRSETLRGNERKSSEPDRGNGGEKEAVSGVQRTGGIREIPAESADVGEVQTGSGGRNSSRDGVRNITDGRAEPIKVSALSDLLEENEPTANTENPYHSYGNFSEYEEYNRQFSVIPKEDLISFLVSDALSSGKIKKNLDTILQIEKGKPLHKEFSSAMLENVPDTSVDGDTVRAKMFNQTLEISCSDFSWAMREAIANSEEYSRIVSDRRFEIDMEYIEKNLESQAMDIKDISGHISDEKQPETVSPDIPDTMSINREITKEVAENSSKEIPEKVQDDVKTVDTEQSPSQPRPQELDSITHIMLRSVLSEEKFTDIGFILYNYGYTDQNSPNADRLFGNDLSEKELFNMAERMQNGEDIRKELALALLGSESTFMTRYYKQINVEYNDDNITIINENDKHQVSYEDIGESFLRHIKEEYDSITARNRAEEEFQQSVYDSRNKNDVSYMQKEFIEIASDILSADETVVNAHRNSDEQNYRMDINDGIDRIFTEAITGSRDIGYSVQQMSQLWNHFQNNSDIKENIQNAVAKSVGDSLDIQELLGGFEAENTTREHEDIEKETTVEAPEMPDNAVDENPKTTVSDLAVGDIILYEGKRREIEELDDRHISLKDLDAPDFGGIILGTSDVLAYNGWQNDMNDKGIEIISKAEEDFKAANSIRSFEDIEKETPENSADKIISDMPKTVSVGDKFRNKTTGEISEVVSLTGALPWYTDDCTVKRESGKFAVTENISYDKLLDPSRYEYIGNDTLSSDKSSQEMSAVKKTADELKVGDVIKYDGGVWRISDIQGDFSVKLENTNTNSANASRGFWGNWKENLDKEGFEYVPVKDVIEQGLYETQTMSDKPKKDFISDGQMSMFGDVPPVEDSEDEKTYQVVIYSNDSGVEYKGNFAEMDKAVEDGRNYLYNSNFDDYYSGLAILNAKEKKVEYYEGDFPLEGIFSNEIYQNSGEWHRVEPNQNFNEPKGEQLELFHVEEERPYQIITYDSDTLSDDKEDYPTLKEALKNANEYLKNGYDGYAVYNKNTQTIEETAGYFPSEKVFSVDVLLKNGVITPEQEPDMIKGLEEEAVRDKVISELLKSERLKKSAENNSREDFAFPYYEAVNNALVDMLDNNPTYAVQKEISYLLDDEEYLHNVFGDYDKIFNQLAPEKENAKIVTVTNSEPEREIPKIKGTPENTVTERQELVKSVVDKAAEVLADSKELEQAYSANGKKEKVFGNSFVQKDFKLECEIAFGNFFMSACRGEVEGLDNVKSLFNDFRENAEFRQSVYNEVSNKVAAAFDNKNVMEQSEVKDNPTAEKNTSAAVAENTTQSEPKVNNVPEAAGQPEKKSDYFRITDEHLGEGSRREKYANNVAAIKTLKQLEEEERPATPEEQETLSKYIGWGGLQEAFDKNDPSWDKEYYELKNLLSESEYKAARATVGDAFYTSPVITNAIYEGLSNIGFKGGEVLEPSMGVGNFFGTMPDSMRENSNLSGVEIDSISGRIAQKIYPEANIAINGFEKVKPSKGAFDLAVGNVPFGNHGVADNTKAYKGLLIHDYFFAKSLDSVRSGGVVAFVTSTGTLDKEDTKVRQMLAQKAELMGAVRLPNNAFQKNAGTPTTTDIIFLKKREKPLNISEMAADKSCDWVHTKVNADGYKINSYFADNPEMVLGNLSDKGNYGSIICTPIQGADLKEQLHEAMKNIKGEYAPLEFQAELDERAEEKYLPATPDIENLTYTVVEDKLYFRVDDNLIPLKESEQHGAIAERRKAMCGLGETTRELLKAQVEDRPDSEIKLLQAELNTKYDFFVKKFGRINPIETPNARNSSGVTRKSANSNAFKNDVRLPLLQSLEKMKEGQFIGKAEIFTERTIRPRQLAEHVETSQEALILSMSEKGKVDFGYMEKLTGFDQKKLLDDLHGEIFPVPYSLNEYQTADEYLSGNIYKKIAAAEECIADNPAFAENIAALTQVIPTPLKATEIDMQLGMTWIDPKIIQKFMYEKFETPTRFRAYDDSIEQKNPNAITVSYSGSGNGSWQIANARSDTSVKATKNFGTKDYNAYQLLEKILNSKSVAVTDTYRDSEGKTKTIILEKETRAAEDKVKLINAEFKKWIFADPERRNELVKAYNEKFNCIRPREYDGSHLNFFGSNPEITLKPHQKNAVAHALFGGNTLFAHEVGAGKTFEMIATAMEGKRLGLHSKSMFVVPNHLTEQIGSDFMKLYPNANILVAKPDDFSPQKRRQMCARIATGNFDAVVIGHSQLIKIPLSPKREKEFVEKQIDEVSSSLQAAKEANGERYTIKQLEATKAKLRERLEKLTNSTVKDNAVTFEELGVDKLFVDEAHEFKNLYVSTKMENVSGLSTNADVQKTQDLYMKCQYLDEKTDGKGIVFSTGTPVTNALSEMFTMQKYLQSDMLKGMGLDSFDSWAGNFTRKSSEMEISPSGSDWRTKTRLKFTNVPELVTMFKECADIKMADQLNLDVPECSKNIVSVEPTEMQKRIVQSLGERADMINKGEVSRTEDNMLVVTSDGRKLGLDQRMFDLSLSDEPQSKLNACVNNVHDIWASTMDKKSTQLIFCDLGVPQSKEDLKKNGERFDVYADIRKKLIEKGIPEKEIAFIHEANSETEKAKLFAKVRSGDVRVLIGSTQKMGAGTNVQNKLIALHDLDCPWRPADLTQRLGRMVRQGNENDRVHNFRYVTKGTFDAYLYQMVEKKQKSISQIFTSKAISRTCDDIDDMTVDFMQVKMAAIGDDRIRRQMELREDIRSLNMLRNTYLDNKYELEDSIARLPQKIDKAEKLVESIAEDVKMIQSYVPPHDIDGKEIYQMKIGNQTFTDKKEAGEAFKSAMTNAIAKNPKNPVEIAEYKGFKIAVSYDPFTRVHHGTLKGAADYPFELGNSESGNLTRIDNVIASVPKRTDIVCNDIERMKTELADSKREVSEPFQHEAELTEKKQELERLTKEIEADKLKGKIAPEQPENTADSKDISPENQSENSVDNKDTPDDKQPENTADSKDISPENQSENSVDNKDTPEEKKSEKSVDNTNTAPEKQSDNSEVIPENTAEKASENVPEKNDIPEKANDTENIPQPEKSEATADEPDKNIPENLNIKWIQNGKKIKISFDSTAENPITAFADGKATGVCKPDDLVVTKIPDSEKKHFPVGITHYVKPLNIAFGSSVAEHVTKFANKVKEICSKIKGREKSLFSRDKIMSDKYKPTSSKDDKNQQNEHSQSM